MIAPFVEQYLEHQLQTTDNFGVRSAQYSMKSWVEKAVQM